MCFSPAASFSSGALLAVTGIASLAKAKNTPQKILAGIPLIFSLQQLTEGVLWMSLLHPAWSQWQNLATYLFLVFAQAIWPVYIPLSILFFEWQLSKRRTLLFLLLCGIALSAYTVYALYRYHAVASAEDHHIRYLQGFPLAKQWYYGLIYFLPTIVSPLMSSRKDLCWLGYLFLVSYAVSRLLFHFYEISVWCFFGAVISVIVFFIINKMARSGRQGSYG